MDTTFDAAAFHADSTDDNAYRGAAPADKPMTAMWLRLQARYDQHQAACKALALQLRGDLQDVLGVAVGAGIEFNADSAKEELRGRILEGLVERAQQQFAPHGAALKVDQARMREALGMATGLASELSGRHRYESGQTRQDVLNAAFDPDAVWAWLRSTYAGESGARVALQAVAKQLDKALGLSHTPPQAKAGGLTITASMGSERDFYGKSNYGHYTLERLAQGRAALASVAAWAGDDATAAALADHHKGRSIDYYGPTGKITSRERIALGAVTMTTYQEKIEIFIAQPLADQFRAFVAKYLQAEG